MIRAVEQSDSSSVPSWHAGFLRMLPAIQRQARIAFKHLRADAREDAVVEVVDNAMVTYARLAELGKTDIAYATPLANFGIRQVRDGRKVGNRRSIRDVLSQYSQRQKNFRVSNLYRYDAGENAWREVVVEDRHATPAEIAAVRGDFEDWLGTLSRRDRQIAETLAFGERTGAVAKRFGVSPVRISQLRNEYFESWQEFHGEAGMAEGSAITAGRRS